MDLEHIDWQTWSLIAVIAFAFLAIAVGFLINRIDDRHAAADPLNRRQHPGVVLRNLVQALGLARQSLGLGAVADDDPDFPALQHARGEARRHLLVFGPGAPTQAAPQQPAPPAQAPAGQAGTLIIRGTNLQATLNGQPVVPPQQPNP